MKKINQRVSLPTPPLTPFFDEIKQEQQQRNSRKNEQNFLMDRRSPVRRQGRAGARQRKGKSSRVINSIQIGP